MSMGPVHPHGSSACQKARTASALAIRASLEGAAGRREDIQQQPSALYRCHLLNVWQSTGKGCNACGHSITPDPRAFTKEHHLNMHALLPSS